jgi:hypothetical protein
MSVSDNIYSAENIERSRGRARAIRNQIEAGIIGAHWLPIVAEVERYADERESAAPLMFDAVELFSPTPKLGVS